MNSYRCGLDHAEHQGIYVKNNRRLVVYAIDIGQTTIQDGSSDHTKHALIPVKRNCAGFYPQQNIDK